MGITRRAFLKDGALAVIGTTVVPAFLARAAYGLNTGLSSSRRLVVIFQRGAADGLNIVVPHAEPSYYSMRPTIAIPRPSRGAESVIDLDGFFGLHPSLASFKPLWDQRHLAIIHAAGSPDPTRSHFDAQDYMESGTPGVKSTQDGWLNRCVRTELPLSSRGRQPLAIPRDQFRDRKAASASSSRPEPRSGVVEEPAFSPFRAVAMGPTLPRILDGPAPAVALSDLNGFGVAGRSPASAMLTSAFQSMYDSSSDSILHGTGKETFEAVKMLKSADPARYTPAPGADYPRGRLGDSLRQLAQLIKANLGVQVAFADISGWDNHVNEGSTQGQLANVLREFSQSIAAFWTDLGPLGEDTAIVTMSEFGRTARENGNRGTDHGHANVMFVLGGPVQGGKVYGRWPGLSPEQLNEGRDLALTTDFRTVLSELVAKQLGNRNLSQVFPEFEGGGSLNLLL
jgi:uncharacterized protein (DUF1501 family)